jgi:hypothetical protein
MEGGARRTWDGWTREKLYKDGRTGTMTIHRIDGGLQKTSAGWAWLDSGSRTVILAGRAVLRLDAAVRRVQVWHANHTRRRGTEIHDCSDCLGDDLTFLLSI